LDFYCASSLK